MDVHRVAMQVVAGVLLAGSMHAECAKGQDHRSNRSGGIQIVDFTISGTQNLRSSELDHITGQMIGGCYDEDSDELQERVRALFQDRGYFRAEVQSLHITPADPLKNPKPVKIEAVVAEGDQVRVHAIAFTGNHHFDSEKLRKEFPMKANDLFERSQIAGGLVSVRKVYTSDGYLDVVMIPNTTDITSTGLDFTIEVREGTQYHMGKLEVFAKKELADRLRTGWTLSEGAVFDPSYVDKYIDANIAVLSSGFTRANVQLVRDCPDATVDVRLLVDAIESASHAPAKSVECEKSEDQKR